ncbi:MAG: hypothetical protein ABRQ39_27885, partial [Candidatus Eremiobacterota bacterium]
MKKKHKVSKENHDWLSLVEMSGLLISEPVLAEHFPEGPVKTDQFLYRKLIKEWERFFINRKKDPSHFLNRWIDFILEDFLGFKPEDWKKHPFIPEEVKVELSDVNQILKPTRVLSGQNEEGEEEIKLLVSIIPPGQSIDQSETKTGKWKVSAHTKLSRLLHETRLPLGLITNGVDFRLLYCEPGLSPYYITWSAQTWIEEKTTADAFHTLLCNDRFRNEEENKLLLNLIRESQDKQIEITDQLGDQIRSAIELFTAALDRADTDKGSSGELLKGIDYREIYEMSLIVMMRLVFILYAEERSLLPHGELFYDRAYGVSYLLYSLEKEKREKPEDNFSSSFDAWERLLALFELIYNGCPHPNINLPSYGGAIFNPERFPVLKSPYCQISNNVIYKILKSLSFARAKLGREYIQQKVSYRTINVEHIGYIYEGLIDYTVKRASEDLLVFTGKEEPVKPISEIKGKTGSELEDYLKNITGLKLTQIKKKLSEEIKEDNKIEGTIEERIKTVKPFLDQDMPLIREGSL